MKHPFIWNFYAKAYDVINENVPYLKMLNEVIKEMELKGNSKILDAGCGTGNLIKKIDKIAFNSQIIGIDSSNEMLNRAKRKFLASPNITFKLVDLNKRLNFSGNSFDRIVSINTLYALDVPEKIISEFYRLLKSQGKLIFANPHNKAELSTIFREQLKELGLAKFIFRFLLNLPSLLVIIIVNIFFLKKNKNYWSEKEAEGILLKNNFQNIKIEYTYANQNLLVSAIKT